MADRRALAAVLAEAETLDTLIGAMRVLRAPKASDAARLEASRVIDVSVIWGKFATDPEHVQEEAEWRLSELADRGAALAARLFGDELHKLWTVRMGAPELARQMAAAMERSAS